MTRSQRAALIEMVGAILACDCADASMRFRAETLQARLTFDFSRVKFGHFGNS